MSVFKSSSSRAGDYVYDPLFMVSGAKDYYRAAVAAKESSAKFQICPIFQNMFSDLPHKPRQQYVLRQSSQIPQYNPDSLNVQVCKTQPIDVVGVDRHKFFQTPVVQKEVRFIPELTIPPPTPVTPLANQKRKRNKRVQTKYRESSAQTSPWEPEAIVIDGTNPELLMLDFLQWGNGLPPGMHEVRLIERARMKRAWEASLPPVTDKASLEKRRKLIAALETEEWAFREQEIQDIHDLRMELLKKMICEVLDKSKIRNEQKIKMFTKVKMAEKEEKLKRLRHKTQRELRKLSLKSRGVNLKYYPVGIVEEHADKKSELYGPLMRHGEHPKRRHLVINEINKTYKPQYLGVEEIGTLPRWLRSATKLKDYDLKLPGTRLCLRETKWTTPVLKQLYEELKNLRKCEKYQCGLLQEIESEPPEVLTPQVDGLEDEEEELHQSTILIESILRGRASQVLIFEGRDRCRELIKELRSTHALQEDDRIEKLNKRIEVKSQHRENVLCKKNAMLVQEVLSRLSGDVVGTMLDFLNKELLRLLDERRIHAMLLLVNRERHAREAAEAGRRQAEIRRRLEHDEIFKQVVKVHQDTVNLYLQDIVTEGLEFASNEEANIYIEDLAMKVDEEAYSTMDTLRFQDKEELIANLIHNFLLPEVEKKHIRDKIKKKQDVYLRTAHNSIYKELKNVFPKEEPIKDETIINTSTVEEEVNTLFVTEDSDVVSRMFSVMDSLKEKENASTHSDLAQPQLTSEFSLSGLEVELHKVNVDEEFQSEIFIPKIDE